MTRNSVIRYFNKVWIKCLNNKDYPIYLVNLLSGEFIVSIGFNHVIINAYPYYWSKKYRFIPFSGIKTEKELFDILRKNCNVLAKIKREYYKKEVFK